MTRRTQRPTAIPTTTKGPSTAKRLIAADVSRANLGRPSRLLLTFDKL
jgi:hypothetical protein